jgi:D-alanyl-D-alanine carboxypeptidase (penicillin-binding protein 5/6)
MGAESGDKRNAMAARLLDYGFANFAVYQYTPEKINDLKVTGGVCESVKVEAEGFSSVIEKGKASRVEYRIELPESISAPIKKGDRVGEIIFTLDGKEIGRSAILSSEEVERIGFFELWSRILAKFFLK